MYHIMQDMTNGSQQVRRSAPESLTLKILGRKVLYCHIKIHKNIMAKAAGHDKEMKNLVGTEVLMAGIEDGKLQGIDDAAHCVDDAA